MAIKKKSTKKKVAKKIGRPPKFTEVEKMQKVIDEYFDSVTYEAEGRSHSRPTMSGLANALNMCRQSLINYSEKTEFLDTIKKARLKVEIALEDSLYGNNVTGVIFNLKNNFGWNDKKEIEQSGSVALTSKKPTRDELIAIINKG